MAQEIQPRIIKPVATPQHFAPSTPRDLRAQAVHRLQVGLFGLCAMLLLVGLANIIMDRAREAEAQDPVVEPVPTVEPTKAATDPLADIGVVPAADPTPEPEPQPTAAPETVGGE